MKKNQRENIPLSDAREFIPEQFRFRSQKKP